MPFFVANYLKPYLSEKTWTQSMDDIGCGIESVEQIMPNLRLILRRLRRSGLKLLPEDCVFGSQNISFLRNVITKEGLQTEKSKLDNFPKEPEIPKSVKQVKKNRFSNNSFAVWSQIWTNTSYFSANLCGKTSHFTLEIKSKRLSKYSETTQSYENANT